MATFLYTPSPTYNIGKNIKSGDYLIINCSDGTKVIAKVSHLVHDNKIYSEGDVGFPRGIYHGTEEKIRGSEKAHLILNENVVNRDSEGRIVW